MGFNLGAGLENMLINAPQIVQAGLAGYQTGEMFQDQERNKSMADALVRMTGFGQGLEEISTQYKTEAAKISELHPLAQGGAMLALNEKTGSAYKQLRNSTFGDNPPAGVTPPPDHWVDGPHELPAMDDYLNGLKQGLHKTIVAALAAKDPLKAAEYLTRAEQHAKEQAAKKALGGRVGELYKQGDQAGLVALGAETGDSNVMHAADLLKPKDVKGPTPIKGNDGIYTMDSQGNVTKAVSFPEKDKSAETEKETKKTAAELRKQIKEDEEALAKLKAPINEDTGEMLPKDLVEKTYMGLGKDKVTTNQRVVEYETQKALYEKRIEETRAELESLSGGKGGKGKTTATHTRKADTDALKKSGKPGKYSHLW